jgi:hypothetical protein
LKKLSHAQEQVTKKRAGRSDINPTAATRQRTAPAPAPAAAVAHVADATPVDDGDDDLEIILDTLRSKLLEKRKAALKRMDDFDSCEMGVKIQKFITHFEEGRLILKKE